jgi:hypothetical protein
MKALLYMIANDDADHALFSPADHGIIAAGRPMI